MSALPSIRPRPLSGTRKRCSPVSANRTQGALGVRTDLETGLMYMRHRWYDPASQRFISRDPIGLEGGANLFTYVENNPIGFVDPEGLDLEVWMVPQGNPPTGNGHVWLEVSENGKSLFSLGAYAGTGKNLTSPEPYCGDRGARKVVSFPTDHN